MGHECVVKAMRQVMAVRQDHTLEVVMEAMRHKLVMDAEPGPCSEDYDTNDGTLW